MLLVSRAWVIGGSNNDLCILYIASLSGPSTQRRGTTYSFPMRSQLHLTVIPTDLPTLLPRMDNPQSCHSGGHNCSVRSCGVIYGRKTAREALERGETSPNLQAGGRNLMHGKHGGLDTVQERVTAKTKVRGSDRVLARSFSDRTQDRTY